MISTICVKANNGCVNALNKLTLGITCFNKMITKRSYMQVHNFRISLPLLSRMQRRVLPRIRLSRISLSKQSLSQQSLFQQSLFQQSTFPRTAQLLRTTPEEQSSTFNHICSNIFQLANKLSGRRKRWLCHTERVNCQQALSCEQSLLFSNRRIL